MKIKTPLLRRLPAAVLLAAALTLCGCGERAAAPAPTPAPTPTATAAPTPEPTPAPTPAPVAIGGESIAWDTRELDLTGNPGTAGELLAALPALPQLARVDLTAWTLTTDEQLALRAAAREETVFDWTVDVQGVPCTSADTFLCLDKRSVDIPRLEQVLPLLPALTQVDMCGCGIDDETMYELNQRWSDVRFVWTTRIGSRTQRTDLSYFRVSDESQSKGFLSDDTLDAQLRYFPDLLALDLGHSWGMVSRCDWVRYTPKLQILILACCNITDISPLAALQDLSYLEIFTNIKLADFSPLAACKNLQDLNISYIPLTDLSFLDDSPALRRLWLVGCDEIAEETVEAFQAAHPACEVMLVRGSMDVTGFGWRKHERFYWMRDMFGADYID